jgi:hypothetical protein
MRVPDEILALDPVQLTQNETRMTDGVDPDVITTAVRRATGEGDLGPGEALVSRSR